MIPPPSIASLLIQDRTPRKSEQHKVSKAIREGRLRPTPCAICGGPFAVHAHHPDYSKPLDVVFLCPSHHVRLHNRLREEFANLKPQEYTRRFHDQVLADLKQAFLSRPYSIHWFEPMIKAATLAERYGVTIDDVQTWKKAGCPVHICGHRMVRFRLSEVETWLEQQALETPAAA